MLPAFHGQDSIFDMHPTSLTVLLVLCRSNPTMAAFSPSVYWHICRQAFRKSQIILLVFYPGDDTPVCSNQLCDYRDNLSVFSDLDVDVLAINTQGLESHERFSKKHDLPFPLLADSDKQVCRSYGAIGLLGTTKRMIVLIDRAGRIRWRCTDLPIFRRTAEEIREVIEDLDL